MPAEVLDADVAATPIPQADLDKQAAQVRQRQQQPADPGPSADDPPDLVVSHSSKSSTFQKMADKLAANMKEVDAQFKAPPAAAAAPVVDPTKPAEPAKAAEPAAAQTDLPQTITGPKAAEWKKLRDVVTDRETKFQAAEKARQDAEKALTEMKAKVAATDETPILKTELKKLQEDKAKIQEQLEKVALERSPEFQSFYQKKFEAAESVIKQSAGEFADKVAHLVNLPESQWRTDQINAISTQLGQLQSAAMNHGIVQFDMARRERDDKLTNSREDFQRLQEIEAAKAKREREKHTDDMEVSYQKALQNARAYEAFLTKESDEVHNAQVKRNERELESFFKGDPELDRLIAMPALAIEGERLLKNVIPALQDKIAKLEASIKQYQAANPAPSGGGNQNKRGAPTNLDDHNARPFINKFKAAMSGS